MDGPAGRRIAGSSLTKRNNRDWMDIIAEILEVCNQGRLKTHVMFRCHLNSKLLTGYLNLAEKAGLLERPATRPGNVTLYKTTPKGVRFIKTYSAIKEILGGT